MNVLTIDIGGSFTKYACMQTDLQKNYRILHRGKIATPQDGRKSLLEALGKIYDHMPDVSGIALSLPGIIDSERGYCSMGGALRYNDDFYLKDALGKRCPVTIYMENDAKCAAMAEAAVGSLKDVSDGFVLILGTMIGGGFIKNHTLYKGTHFSAGEVSYIATMRSGKPSCKNVWGNRCGTPRLCKMYAQKKNLKQAEVNGFIVFQAINNQDADALACLDCYTNEIAVQIFNLQTILDPERFAIGGGISTEPVFIEYIKKNLDALYSVCPYNIPHAEVVSCTFQHDANLIGALQCYLANC